ncbi:unnamed protein product [Ophioblennius macclurei]
MTGNISALICCLLLSATAEVCEAQTERIFPQWLSGIIAVTCFLLVVFISFLLKNIWCDSPDTRKQSLESDVVQDDPSKQDLEDFRSKRLGDDSNSELYDMSLDVLRRPSDKETESAQDRVYETCMDGFREQSPEERETTMDNEYEVNLDSLRSTDHRNAYTSILS